MKKYTNYKDFLEKNNYKLKTSYDIFKNNIPVYYIASNKMHLGFLIIIINHHFHIARNYIEIHLEIF